MAKKKDKANQPRPQQPEPEEIIEIIEEPEEIVEIVEIVEEPAEIVDIVEVPEVMEIIDEPEIVEVIEEPATKPPTSVMGESSAVDLGGPVAKLEDGSDILEVAEGQLEFVEPPKKKPVPPPPGARPQRQAPPPPGARARPQSGVKPESGKKLDAGPPKPTMPVGKPTLPTQMAPAKGAPTQLSPGKQAQPTQLAPGKKAQPTQLAPAEDLLDLAPAESTGKGKAGPPTAAPDKKATQIAPGKHAPATQLASKQAQTTQLAPTEELANLAAETGQSAAPKTPAKKDAGGKAPAAFPNLSIDEPGGDVLDVIDEGLDIIEVIDEPRSGKGAKAPASGTKGDEGDIFDLIDEELLSAESSAVNLDRPASDKPSGVDIIAEELESQVGLDKTAALEAMGEDVPDEATIHDLLSGGKEPEAGEHAVVHELLADDLSSAVDLGTAAGEPPMPIEIGDDLLVTDEMTVEGGKKAPGLDVTQPFTLEGKEGDEEAVVIDESLLVDEAGKEGGDKLDEVNIEDLIDIDALGEDETGRKGKKFQAAEDEALFGATGADEEEEAVFDAAVVGEGEEVFDAAAVEEEEDGGAVAVATKTKPKRKRRVEEEDEEEEDDRSRRRRPRPRKPRYGRRWLGGMLLGILLVGGAVAGLIATKPEEPKGWLKEYAGEPYDAYYDYYILQGPGEPGIKATKKTPTQQAMEFLHQGEFDKALNLVQNATPEEKEKLAIKGQAEWLEYLKNKGSDPFNKNDSLVKKAIASLDAAEKPLLRKQIDDAIMRDELEKSIGQSNLSQVTLKKLLEEQKFLDPDKPGDTTKIVEGIINDLKKQDMVAKALKKDKDDLDTKVKGLEMVEDAVRNMLVNEKVLPAGDPLLKDVSKSIAKALQDRKKATELVDLINAKLKDAKIADPEIKGVEALVIARDKLEKEFSELQKAAEEAFKTINEGKPLPAGADLKKQLVDNASIISEKAKAPLVNAMGTVVSVFRDMSGDMALWLQGAIDKTATEAKLKFYEAREPLIESPEKKIDTWVSLFHGHGFKGAAEIGKAKIDANWIASPEAGAGPEIRAKAVYLQGLLARNQEQFDQARTFFGEAIKQASALGLAPAWKADVTRALEELTDAKVYFLPTAHKLALEPSQQPKAIAQLNVGLKALPNDPLLLLERAKVQFKMVPPDAKPAMEQQQAIRGDAVLAAKHPVTAPEANFILGQLEERLGALDKAMGHYEQALSLVAKDNKQDASRYQQAIGRLLLIDPTLVPVPPPAPAAEGKAAASLEQRDTQGEAPTASVSLWTSLALVTVLAQDIDKGGGVVDPDELKKEAQTKQLLQVAEKFKLSEDPKIQGQGYMLYGLAVSQQGKRTEGLMNYVKGMKLFYPGIEAEQLKKLVEAHPAFMIPDVLTRPDPKLAEAHFGAGVHLYFEAKYKLAEEQFFKAITYHKDDARYHYFLGLAQHNQKNKEKEVAAQHNIKTGAILEVQDLPTTKEISLSLERIQGSLRQYLNEMKAKAKLGE